MGAGADGNTFFSLAQGMVLDVTQNAFDGIAPTPAALELGVAHFQADVIRPYLVSFNVSMDSGRVTMLFSETIDVSSFDVTGLTFHSSESNPAQSYTPSHAASSRSVGDGIVLTFTLNISDQN